MGKGVRSLITKQVATISQGRGRFRGRGRVGFGRGRGGEVRTRSTVWERTYYLL